MKKPTERVWFLALCVELYKHAKGMSGREAFDFLCRAGAVDYLTDCADALHATGHLYIIESIDEYLAAHGQRAPAAVE
ncbi:MAG: DUF3791 domain-containing protein [Clostridiales bacterium]|nr:DUF3791 domain-containing protein [Clostridiales bacterium]